ncbi:hypothetical protein PanWU01x14_354230, partial [Parasponia andersonii]
YGVEPTSGGGWWLAMAGERSPDFRVSSLLTLYFGVHTFLTKRVFPSPVWGRTC